VCVCDNPLIVRILSTLDREALKPNASVALHRHSHSVVDILPPESDSTIQVSTAIYVFSFRSVFSIFFVVTSVCFIYLFLLRLIVVLNIHVKQLMVTKPDVTYADIGGCDIQKQEVWLCYCSYQIYVFTHST
jgi:hypothetical protein